MPDGTAEFVCACYARAVLERGETYGKGARWAWEQIVTLDGVAPPTPLPTQLVSRSCRG
jgi:hypothetical protein